MKTVDEAKISKGIEKEGINCKNLFFLHCKISLWVKDDIDYIPEKLRHPFVAIIHQPKVGKCIFVIDCI